MENLGIVAALFNMKKIMVVLTHFLKMGITFPKENIYSI
jgi:hypothetical protein